MVGVREGRRLFSGPLDRLSRDALVKTPLQR
jgi:hypothetical protein